MKGELEMAKTGIRNKKMSAVGKAADISLAKALLKLMAVGIAGGAALLAGGKKAGDAILAAEEKKKLENKSN